MRRKHPDLFTDGVGGNGGGKPPKPPKASLPQPEDPDRYNQFKRDGKLAPENDRHRYFLEDEKISADILESMGHRLVSIESYKKRKAPDAYDETSGKFIEFKTPERLTTRGLLSHLRKAAAQAPHVFVRFSEAVPTEAEVQAFLDSNMEVFNSTLETVIIEVKGGKHVKWTSSK